MTERTKPRIVAGIAEAQPATLRFAIDEAQQFDLELEIVHCAGYVNYATRVIDQIRFENWLEAAQHVLDEARVSVSREPDPPKTHYRMSDQPPIDEFLDVSDQAAEIVLGSDNPSWFSRVMNRTVSQTLAFTARCPVVVVPEQAPTPPWAHGVVVGIEGTRPEEHILRYAFEHADRSRTKLHVVHALPVDSWAGEVDAHEAAVAEALAGWSEKFPDVAVTRKFVLDEPARVCARATMSAELVVIGQPHGHQIPFGIDKPLSNALLQRACGPVAIVPDPLS
jgi:nucleotide-binding universal stress UspA family protein